LVEETRKTHRSAPYADCLLKNTSTKDNKNSSMLMVSVSDNVLVESEWFFYITK